MLASTMQISNNNPTNTLTHHQPTIRRTRSRALGQREDQKKQATPGHARRRLILQDPTVCSTTPPTNVRLHEPDPPPKGQPGQSTIPLVRHHHASPDIR